MVDEDRLTFGVLLLSGGHHLFVFNWRDQLYVVGSLPEHVREACSNELPL